MNNSILKLFDLKNQNIIITGSAGRLGSQFATILSEVGANVILVDIDKKKNIQLEKKLQRKYKTKAKSYTVDLSQPVEIISFQYGNKTLNPFEIRSESSLPSATKFGNHFFTIPPSNGKVEEKKYRFLIHEENEKSKSSMSKRSLTVNAKFLGHSYTPPPMRIPIDECSFDPTRSTINNDDLQLDSIPYKSSEGLIKTIQISAGIYNSSKPIYIPEDYLLSIEAGTSFFLSKNSTFVCRGSIRAIGTKDNPIVFTSSDKT